MTLLVKICEALRSEQPARTCSERFVGAGVGGRASWQGFQQVKLGCASCQALSCRNKRYGWCLGSQGRMKGFHLNFSNVTPNTKFVNFS